MRVTTDFKKDLKKAEEVVASFRKGTFSLKLIGEKKSPIYSTLCREDIGVRFDFNTKGNMDNGFLALYYIIKRGDQLIFSYNKSHKGIFQGKIIVAEELWVGVYRTNHLLSLKLIENLEGVI